MKRIPLEQLRQAPGNLWHDAFQAGRVVDGTAIEVPDEFELTARPEPVTLPLLFGPDRLLPGPDQTARLAQCQTCEKNVAGNCALCHTCGGRPVIHKVKRARETCPLGRWPAPPPIPHATAG